MTSIPFATSSADGTALDDLVERHAELVGALSVIVDRMHAEASRGMPSSAQQELVRWVRGELLPQLDAERRTLYPAAHDRPEARALVAGLQVQHEALSQLDARIAGAGDAIGGVAAAVALRSLVEVLLRIEDEQLLPLLAAAGDVSLSDLVAALVDALPRPASPNEEHPPAQGGHACGCDEQEAGDPELDARIVPHAIRHATIFGALDAVAPGRALVLLAPHDPLPLLAQVQQRHPDRFRVEYLQRGPETWRLRFARRAA